MRLDKFLKVSRLVKRRTVAAELCNAGRVSVNGRQAKAGTQLAIDDIVELTFGERKTRVKVLDLKETVRKNEATDLYVILPDETERDEVEGDEVEG